jgi:uncharacterized protein YecE (DUF72 family)
MTLKLPFDSGNSARTHLIERLRPKLAWLAQRGVYVGTSSWKYAGWIGQLYDEARYVYRGRFSDARFQRMCLSEYAEVFKSVGVDAAYYAFPTRDQLTGWMDSVPSDFRFSFKVTDDITLKRFPNLPRFGHRAGKPNPDFLNAAKFEELFLGPCAEFRDRVGVLMFEFTRFHASDFLRGRDFVDALDAFLKRLPSGWDYGVEIRNATFLQPEYFQMLAQRGVAPVFNSWEAMPPLSEQMKIAGALAYPELAAARLLLRPGRAYADAVARFSPYAELKEAYPEARLAAAGLIQRTVKEGKPKRSYVYVNNRLEGNAIQTIDAILEQSQVPGNPSG